MSFKLLSVRCTVFSMGVTFSQTKTGGISGKVVDKRTQQPVPGAVVDIRRKTIR